MNALRWYPAKTNLKPKSPWKECNMTGTSWGAGTAGVGLKGTAATEHYLMS